jgi:hypothetical protein
VVGLFSVATNTGVPITQQQAIGRANARANQAKITRGFEQAGIPALPSWQELFYLISQRHADEPLTWTQ